MKELLQKKHSYFLFLIFIYSAAFPQNIDQTPKIRISGIIYNAKTIERVPFTHIIDMNKNRGTSADDNGNFNFSAHINDSIKFTAIGFNDFILVIKDSMKANSFVTIHLAPKTYMLETLDFYATDPMKGFYLRDIKRDTIRYGSKGMPGADYWNVTPSGGSGYISAFANLFNRHHKQEKKLSKILAVEERIKMENKAEIKRRKIIREKYNAELVQRITDLEGVELEKFIEEYKPTDLFILRSTVYEVALQIVNSYRDYRYENGLEVDISEILKRAKFKD